MSLLDFVDGTLLLMHGGGGGEGGPGGGDRENVVYFQGVGRASARKLTVFPPK